MGGTVSWHYDGPVDCELLGREDVVKELKGGFCIVASTQWGDHFIVEAADNLRIDKNGTVLLRKIGDDVGAICREPGFN